MLQQEFGKGLEEQGANGVQGSGAVADLIFELGGDLRHGFVILGQIKNGIVAKSAITSGGSSDEALTDAFGATSATVGSGSDNTAAKARLAFVGRDSGQAL